ncbi:MAG: ribonuclease P protein component [Sphaerochaetaceae bacterium]|jgi:ribonuclease P protein component|nr:ribonuclease P protein component [Sphaerochaetaceae bacterium]
MRKSLSKDRIVRSKGEIQAIFQNGKVYSVPDVRLRIKCNGLEYSRIIVIPVKHFGNSVQRNLVRRQFKEIFRLEQERIETGFDLALVLYKGRTLSYDQKKEAFTSLIEKAGLLRK